jgi:DNA-binding LacI/PurR family transcriptional regulator
MQMAIGNRESKAERVRTAVEAMAKDLGPGGKLPTVRELCGQLGVTRVTLGGALDQLEASGVITRRRGSGIYVDPRIAQKCIGLVFGANVFELGVSPFYRMLLEHCRRRAEGKQFRFSFYVDLLNGAGDLSTHHDLEEDIRQGRVHGLFFTWRRDEKEELWVREQGIPVVKFSPQLLIDATARRRGVVAVDYLELIRLGVQGLAKDGSRRIGLITPFGYLRPHDADLREFRMAMREHGLTCREEWIWENREDRSVGAGGGETREEQGYRAVRSLLEKVPGERPDGVLVLDDMLTRGVLAGLARLGLQPGRDIRIASQANAGSPALQGSDNSLTLIEFDPDEIIDAMFSMIERWMDGAEPPEQGVLIGPRVRSGHAPVGS